MEKILAGLYADTRKKIILDTDTYNEIDDQYALAYSILAKDRLELLSVSAVPFLNARSVSPEDGMEKSYAEIRKIMDLTEENCNIPIYKGARCFMPDADTPVPSPAAENIIRTVSEADEMIYVLAIGAATNVASAILLCPEIKEKMVVVWLGGHALEYPNAKEFNLMQDPHAASVLLNSGVNLILVPAFYVTAGLVTSIPELTYYLGGKNPLCDYLVGETRVCWEEDGSQIGWSRVIWDIAAPGLVAYPLCADIIAIPAPILTSDFHYVLDAKRHRVLYVRNLYRDGIYNAVFTALMHR